VSPAPERRRLVYGPRPVVVRVDGRGRPALVAGRRVASIAEEWLVEDGWWNERPLRRHYFEAVLEGGGDAIVFRDAESGEWFRQRA
jgi:hypothetical protein